MKAAGRVSDTPLRAPIRSASAAALLLTAALLVGCDTQPAPSPSTATSTATATATASSEADAHSASAHAPDANATSVPLVARIGGEAIHLDTLDAFFKEELFDQATQHGDPVALYRARSGALTRLVERRVLEQEAARRGLDVEALLAEETSEQEAVDDAALRSFYDEHVATGEEPEAFEAAAPRIRQLLEERRRRAAVKGLLAAAEVEVSLESPTARLAEGQPSTGPAEAPVTLIVFTDYASLDSARAEPLLAELASRYPDTLRIARRTLVREASSFHNGRGAAAAAICGDRLGAFAALHPKLLAQQRSLSPEAIRSAATEAGLEREAFERCLEAPETRQRLEADMTVARQLGIHDAPAYLVNGRLVQGEKPLPVLVGLVESERGAHPL